MEDKITREITQEAKYKEDILTQHEKDKISLKDVEDGVHQFLGFAVEDALEREVEDNENTQQRRTPRYVQQQKDSSMDAFCEFEQDFREQDEIDEVLDWEANVGTTGGTHDLPFGADIMDVRRYEEDYELVSSPEEHVWGAEIPRSFFPHPARAYKVNGYELDNDEKIEQYFEQRYGPELRGEVPQEELAPDHPLSTKYGSWRMETVDWDSARLPRLPGATYEGQVSGAVVSRKYVDETPSQRGLAMHGLGVLTFGRQIGDTEKVGFVPERWEDIAPARIGAYKGYQLPEGSRYEGEFRNGAAHGYGVLKIPGKDGRVREVWGGQWLEGMRHGCGIEIDFSEHNHALRSKRATPEQAKDLIRDTYGLWKVDSFISDAVFPWEHEPQLVVGQHFGKHEDLFEDDGLPKFDTAQLTSILDEQEENYHRRSQMQRDAFASYMRKDLRYEYCRTGDAWQSFRNAVNNADMAKMFENKPDGIVYLQKSFTRDPKTGEKEFIKPDTHPLFYPLGTQCLMPGPAGQLFSIPSELRSKMVKWVRWHDFIHSLSNFDPRDPPFPKDWENELNTKLKNMLNLMQRVRNERTEGFEKMKAKFRKRIDDGDIDSEDELKLMRWVLRAPDTKPYPITEEQQEEFAKTPTMVKKWFQRLKNTEIKPMPKRYLELMPYLFHPKKKGTGGMYMFDKDLNDEDDRMFTSEFGAPKHPDSFDNRSIQDVRERELRKRGLRLAPLDTRIRLYTDDAKKTVKLEEVTVARKQQQLEAAMKKQAAGMQEIGGRRDGDDDKSTNRDNKAEKFKTVELKSSDDRKRTSTKPRKSMPIGGTNSVSLAFTRGVSSLVHNAAAFGDVHARPLRRHVAMSIAGIAENFEGQKRRVSRHIDGVVARVQKR